MNLTNYIREQLNLALVARIASGEHCRLCNFDEAANVIVKAKANFVRGERKHWWWEFFKKPVRKTGIYPEHPYFADYLDLSAGCWLIVDDDSSDLPVVETTVKGAEQILGELPAIEFYLVGTNFDWLLAENHHGKIWLL